MFSDLTARANARVVSVLADIGTPDDPTRSGIASTLANTAIMLFAIAGGVLGGWLSIRELGKSGESNQKIKNVFLIVILTMVVEAFLGSLWYFVNIAHGLGPDVV